MKTIRSCLALLGAALLLLTHLSAFAQPNDYPSKPIHLIVPFSAGGVVDSIARVIGERLGAKYGTPVVVENRAGAAGSIGTAAVARAAPDGYTLLFVSPGFMTAPSLQKGLPWNPVKDFRAVAGLGLIPNVIVVPASSNFKTLPDLIDYAKKNPGKLEYGSSGIGTTQHLAGELLAQKLKLKLVHVPYKGQPEAVSDLLAERLSFMPLSVGLALPHMKAGKLRALAVTTAKRSQFLPEVPTVEEAAATPGYEVSTWFGIVATARTPDALLRKLSADTAAALASPEVKQKMDNLGLELNVQSGADFDTYLRSESTKWTLVLQQAGISPE
jgi:tripartite-type tricarboxylate transporter receptor subunit TctC